MLDVCAGLSDFTARLLILGADAYALDYGYSDIEELLIRANRRTPGLFPRSVLQDRNRYIYGSAHKLPFPSESFDAVTSYDGIFGVIDDDVDLAYQSIDEGIRVLKPRGILSIGPLMSGDITQRQAVSEVAILEKLDKRDDILPIVRNPYRKPNFGPPLDVSRQGKLTIIKSA